MRTGIATAAIVLAGLAAFAWITDGFRAVTSETARRLAVAEAPPRLPDVALLDPGLAPRPLRGLLADDGRVALVDFIYTRCESICTALGSEYQQLQREIAGRGLRDRVRLLSISFDPAHDRPDVLAGYARRLRADPGLWQITTVAESSDLDPLLRIFGIVVIPDGLGGYAHNAAIHVVSPDGRLLRIRDVGEWRLALDDALRAVP